MTKKKSGRDSRYIVERDKNNNNNKRLREEEDFDRVHLVKEKYSKTLTWVVVGPLFPKS